MDERKYTAEEIREKLQINDHWVERGILAIHNFQTTLEKNWQETTEHNNVGFNGVDAGLLSSFAERLNSGKTLTEKQMFWARKKMLKYSGQLAKIANGQQAKE